MNQNDDIVYIEFMGLPGSGKSTLSTSLCRQLNKNGYNTESFRQAVRESIFQSTSLFPASVLTRLPENIQKYFYELEMRRSNRYISEYARISTKFPNLINIINNAITHNKINEAERQLASEWVIKLLARYSILYHSQSVPYEFLTFAEGFCNRTPAIYMDHHKVDTRENIQQYINAIPMPETVILPDVEKDICLSRIDNRTEREPWRMQRLSYEEKVEFMTNYQQCLEIVAKCIETSGGSIIRVDNTRDLERVTQNLYNQILKNYGK